MTQTEHQPQYLEGVYATQPHPIERAQRWLNSAKAITRLHREHQLDKVTLETQTFSLQLSAWFDPPQSGDRILGRVKTSPIGVSPEPGGLGYYCDSRAISALLEKGSLTPAEKNEWTLISDFWKERTTSHAIESNPPISYKNASPGYDYNTLPGAIFGLNRLAGCQWSHHNILKKGLTGLQKDINDLVHQGRQPQRLKAWHQILQAFRQLFLRFKNEAENLAQLSEGENKTKALAMAKDAQQLEQGPPQTFAQALQLIWVVDAGVGCINHGRLDDDLVPFWQPGHDQVNIEFLVELWQRIEERKTVFNGRVIVGGEGRRFPEGADRVAHLCLEATSRHHGIEPQLTLRLSKSQDPTLLDHGLECLAKGRTYPMLYWDENLIPSVQKAHDISREEAEQWVPYGCGEFVLLGRSIGTPNGIVNAARILEEVIFGLPLGSGKIPHLNQGPSFVSIDALWEAYENRVQQSMAALADWQIHTYRTTQAHTDLLPLSMMMDGAIDNNCALFDQGGHLQGGTMELYGMVDASDSLRAIEEIVFGNPGICWQELRQALLDNFQGHEVLHARLNRIVGFGNDDQEANSWAQKVHRTYCQHTSAEGKRAGLDSFLVVVINNWTNTVMGRHTGALPCGRKKGTALANANGPRPGQDNQGPSALLASMASLENGLDAGTVQNLKLCPEWFEHNAQDLKALLQQYQLQGGTQLMITVSRPEELREAMERPQDYGHLMVRVGGFSARFIDLPKDCQQEILGRTLH